MKTLIQIHKEEKYFVAVDLITNVADQGLTESEAVSNLKKGLEEHYQVLGAGTQKDGCSLSGFRGKVNLQCNPKIYTHQEEKSSVHIFKN